MEATDLAAVERTRGGDTAAFRVLVERYGRSVFRLAFRMTGNEFDAEDVVQETFLRAFKQLDSYESRSSFGTWLYRLAANTALMELRARRSRPQSDGDEGLEDFGTPDSAGHATALSLDLERAVATLPPRARAVLVLYDVEGWKHEEIAQALGMAIGSSKAQLHRARGLLRARLGGKP